SVDAYVDQALTLAADSALRTVYHQTLRRAMAASPLCDPLSLARALEDTYRDMWRRHLVGGR
ncbi:MAG TPA: hypothetical protein VK973_07965, partial [Arenicellales bacterium]|nr:hypothetical protein [Arenicellales bacterium]